MSRVGHPPKHKGLTEKTIAEALQASAGMLTMAARKLGVGHSALCYRLDKSPALQAARIEAKESILDLAEIKLFENIKKGDNQAIMFLLRTKGKHRGYVEAEKVNPKVTVDNLSNAGLSRITVEFVGNNPDPESV